MDIVKTTQVRTTVGLVIWLIVGFLGGWYLIRDFAGVQRGTAKQVTEFVFTPRQTIELNFPSPQFLNKSETIFQRHGDRFIRVGEIVAIQPLTPGESVTGGWTEHATAEIYACAARFTSNDRLTYIPSTESMSWVVASLMTPQRRTRINALLQDAYVDHHREIAAHFRPIIEETLREASVVIWEDLQRIAPEYDKRLRAIGERYRKDLVDGRLVPLLRDEILPIVIRESEPLANRIGEEIWNEASIWRFGWRAMYDVLPLPQRDLTKREFERFVQIHAVPVLQRNIGDILQLQQRIFATITQSTNVQREVAASLQHVLRDSEAQALAVEMLQRVVANNPRLNQIVTDIWNSPKAKETIELANEKLEFTIASIGEELFGNPHTAITPEFSRVLRFKVLHKDCQWLVLERGDGAGDVVHSTEVIVGMHSIENPFHVSAENRN